MPAAAAAVEKERRRYKAWYKQAGHDLGAAKVSFENGYNEWAAYQAEQTVEKVLKSVIVHAGERAPKVHKLSVLFGYCNSVNPAFKNTKFIFRHVEAFTFISRYPFLIPGKDQSPHELISENDAKESIKEAEDIYSKIAEILQEEVVAGVEADIIDEAPQAISKEMLHKRLDEVTDVLVREFNPEKVVLFGSYARKPLPKVMSTIDILIIAETELSFIERIQKARESTKGAQPSIEPLIYTPKEFKIMTEEEGESFFESALEEGTELYAKA